MPYVVRDVPDDDMAGDALSSGAGRMDPSAAPVSDGRVAWDNSLSSLKATPFTQVEDDIRDGPVF